MLRFVALSIFVLVLVPLASAEGLAVGPDGLADPTRDEHYYVWVVPSSPSTPTIAKPTDDCAGGARPGATATALGIAEDLAAWDPMTDFGAGTWAPTCVSASTQSCGSSGTPCISPGGASPNAHAAYNVSSGRYYVEITGTPIPGAPSAQSLAFTGTTGVGLFFDCVGCTPPVCCDN